MKVIKAIENDYGFIDEVEFDNGLRLSSVFTPDCCAENFLDFEQLHVGREFPTMTGAEFRAAIRAKEDGFSIMDAHSTPAWVQARSIQNGYYSSNVDLVTTYAGVVGAPVAGVYGYDRQFSGEIEELV